MKRSISQRIYRWGLTPLAMLAIALIIWNGVARLHDAKQELKNAQSLTATLLHAPAVDALVVGNTLTFDQLVKDVINTTPTLTCISLRDLGGRVIVEAGECLQLEGPGDSVDILASNAGLSDYDSASTTTRVGRLRISMSEKGLIERRRQLIWQLVISLALVLTVVAIVIRVLRARLIQPIQNIASAMLEVSNRNYTPRLASNDEDEIGRLGLAINTTIETIAVYMRELERRRADADRALHDADEAALARDGLVQSLSEELEGPLSRMYAEMTALAMSNKDTAMREQIKRIMGLLDEAQSNFDDLREVSSSSQSARPTSMQEYADVATELQRSVRILSTAAAKALILEIPTVPFPDAPSLYVEVDGSRLRKAVSYVLKAMFEHCTERGINAQFETIKLSDAKLHISMQLKAFYGTPPNTPKTAVVSITPSSKAPPAALRWSERDKKVIEYLLRAANVAVTYSILPSGMVFVNLETIVNYTTGSEADLNDQGWIQRSTPIVTTIISDDISLMRLTMRGYLSRHEVKLLPYQAALRNIHELRSEDALVLDCGSDIASVLELLDGLKHADPLQDNNPQLIAICPPGALSETLEDRLLEFGFKAVIQKPIQLSKLLDVLQKIVSEEHKRNNV